MQKFSRSGCVLSIATSAVLTVAVYRYLPPETGDARPWFSVASAVLLASGLSSLWLLLTGRAETRGSLLQRSQGAAPIGDGEAIVATGTVRAAPPPLTAPLSGAACVAYFYRCYYIKRSPGRFAEQVPVYWGYAARPLVVDTPSRAFAIAAPQLSITPAAHSGDEAVARVREHIRTAGAEVRMPRPFFAGDPIMQWMKDIAPDEDGGARLDWRSEEQFDLATLQLEELVLPPQAEVTVYGRWSARRNAIWTDDTAGGVPPTLTLGPPTALGLAAAGVPSRSGSWVGTLLTFALGAGLIWFAIEVWPQLN
jgi:hypothetical protein